MTQEGEEKAGGGPNALAAGGEARVYRRGDRLEVRFGRRFSRADVEAVKAIPGRRWLPDRCVWQLPATDSALAALARTFGGRLVLSEPLRAPAPPPQTTQGPAAARRTGFAEPASRRSPVTRRQERPAPDDRAAASGSGSAVPDDDGAIDSPQLLETMRRSIGALGYSRKTERAYLGWARRFLAFLRRGEPVGAANALHARAFLEHLAVHGRLAARSRNQAASALGFLFREVLGTDEPLDLPRAKGPRRMPLVLTHREVLRILRQLTGKYFLIGVLLYSAGLRVEECLRLRVKDVDFELRQILVRDGKGRKDRYVPLATRAADLLRAQIARVRALHLRDRSDGAGWAPLPGALHRKDPGAGFELGWQWIFPGSTIGTDPATGRKGRRPLHVTAVQRQIKRAVRDSGIPKRATCHTFRHSFATESLRGGCDIRTLQSILGHNDVRTTMIYLHVVEQTGLAIRSPLDRPDETEEDADIWDITAPLAAPAARWELGARQWAAGSRTGPAHRAASGSAPRRDPAPPDAGAARDRPSADLSRHAPAPPSAHYRATERRLSNVRPSPENPPSRE
jgi:integron integrase